MTCIQNLNRRSACADRTNKKRNYAPEANLGAATANCIVKS